MNGLQANVAEALIVRDAVDGDLASIGADVLIAPPATLMTELSAAIGKSPLLLAGQDCHAAPSGPHTGDIAPEMLKEAGASAVIVGHSERRGGHGGTGADGKEKGGGA